jgi:hypothetical protein
MTNPYRSDYEALASRSLSVERENEELREQNRILRGYEAAASNNQVIDLENRTLRRENELMRKALNIYLPPGIVDPLLRTLGEQDGINIQGNVQEVVHFEPGDYRNQVLAEFREIRRRAVAHDLRHRRIVGLMRLTVFLLLASLASRMLVLTWGM